MDFPRPIKSWLDKHPGVKNRISVESENVLDLTIRSKSVVSINEGHYATIYRTIDKNTALKVPKIDYKLYHSKKNMEEKEIYLNTIWHEFLDECKIWWDLQQNIRLEQFDEADSEGIGSSSSKINVPEMYRIVACRHDLTDDIYQDFESTENQNQKYLILGIEMKLYSENLFGYLTTKKENRKLNLDVICKIMTDLIDAVNLLHRNHVLHNDIAVRNCLISDSDLSVLLMDFGLSCKMHHRGSVRNSIIFDSKSQTNQNQNLMQIQRNKISQRENIAQIYVDFYEKVDPQAQSFYWSAPEILKSLINDEKFIRYDISTDYYQLGMTFVELIFHAAVYFPERRGDGPSDVSGVNSLDRSYLPLYCKTDPMDLKLRMRAVLERKKNPSIFDFCIGDLAHTNNLQEENILIDGRFNAFKHIIDELTSFDSKSRPKNLVEIRAKIENISVMFNFMSGLQIDTSQPSTLERQSTRKTSSITDLYEIPSSTSTSVALEQPKTNALNKKPKQKDQDELFLDPNQKIEITLKEYQKLLEKAEKLRNIEKALDNFHFARSTEKEKQRIRNQKKENPFMALITSTFNKSK